jgi:hypothetical protein
MVRYGKRVVGVGFLSIDRVAGAVSGVRGLRSYWPQQTAQGRLNQAMQPASSRADQVSFSADSVALNRLVRTWGALSQLFGGQRASATNTYWNPAALRQTLLQARQNAEVMEQRRQVLDTLKSSVLRGAEALVDEYFGLKGDGATLGVVFDDHMEGALASVRFAYDRNGRMVNQTLHINMSEFVPDTGPNGTNRHVIENDRIIAHELTHVIMGRNLNMAALPDWFAEGTAEYVAGGAERVGFMLQHYSPARLMNRLQQRWEGDSSQYAAAYIAVRFLDEAAQAGGGLRAIIAQLKEGASLDKASAKVSEGRFADTAHFLSEVAAGGQGARFIAGMDLSGRDAGSIRTGPGPSVVPDTGSKREQPLQNLKVQWPLITEGFSFGGAPGFGGFTPWTVALGAYRIQTSFEQERS